MPQADAAAGPVLEARLEGGQQRAVVPEVADAAGGKARPQLVADLAEVLEDGARVVELVSHRHQQRVGGLGGDLVDINLFAHPPARRVAVALLFGIAVGAGLDDRLDPVAEARADLVGRHLVRLVFQRVVQQRADRLVLVAAVLEHDGRDPDEVRHIGDVAAFALLVLVQLRRPDQGLAEAFAYCGHGGSSGGLKFVGLFDQ